MEKKNINFYNRTFFLQEFSKELTMVLPAQELKPAPPFSPILSQYGLNANEFCEKFNKETINFPAGTPIAISIFYIPKEKKFEFNFRPFQLKFVLQQFVKFDENYKIYTIDFLDLYKSLIIKSFILNDNHLHRILRNIKGTLKSYERPLMININKQEYNLNFKNVTFAYTGEYPIKLEEEVEITDDEYYLEDIQIEPQIQENFWKKLKKKKMIIQNKHENIFQLFDTYYDKFSLKK